MGPIDETAIPTLLGFVGIGVTTLAYVPQIIHLHKEHCSAGISLRAYSLWCVSSALFLVHAVMIRDRVFIGVQLVNMVALAIITILVKRYGGYVCTTHLEIQRGRSGDVPLSR